MSSGMFAALYLIAALFGVAFVVGILYLMAKNKILLFFPKEGQIYAIMKGGKFHKFLASVEGWHLEKREDGYDHMTQNVGLEGDELTPWYTHLLGIAFIGIPPIYKVYEYPFSWVKMGKEKDSTSFKLVPRHEERVDSLFFQFPYGFEIEELETRDNVPVTVQVLATVQILVPYKTLFMTHDWLAQLTGYINDKVKLIIAQKGISDVQNIEEAEFQEALFSLNIRVEEANMGLEPLIGVRIIDADFLGYDIVTDEETKKAMQSVEIAQQRAKARIIEAEAERRYLEETVGYVAGDDPSRRVEAAKWVWSKKLPDVYVEGNKGGERDNRPPVTLPAPRTND